MPTCLELQLVSAIEDPRVVFKIGAIIRSSTPEP